MLVIQNIQIIDDLIDYAEVLTVVFVWLCVVPADSRVSSISSKHKSKHEKRNNWNDFIRLAIKTFVAKVKYFLQKAWCIKDCHILGEQNGTTVVCQCEKCVSLNRFVHTEHK